VRQRTELKNKQYYANLEKEVSAQFKTHHNVGHGITPEVNLDVTKFFLKYFLE